MPTRSYKPEQIVAVLRQIEVQMANGKTAPQACKEAGIHTQTYYRWRKVTRPIFCTNSSESLHHSLGP